MYRRAFVAAAIVWVGVLVLVTGRLQASKSPQQVPAAAELSPLQQQSALLSRYCITCHNQRAKAGGLALDTFDLATAGEHPEVWEKVVRKLLGGVMPPPGRPRPNEMAYDGVRTWLETQLDRAATASPNPGRTESLHRLNRTEYQNAIRDLLDLQADITAVLPADDASYGFDNMASALRISQSAMEQYLSAARKISRAAIGSALPGPVAQDFRDPPDLRQYERGEGLPFGTRGGKFIPYTFPQNGEYEIEVELMCDATDCDGAANFPDRHQLEISIDGERVQLFTIEPQSETRPKTDRAFRVRVPVKAGPRQVTVAFLALPSTTEVDQRVARFIRPYFGYGSTGLRTYQPYVDRVSIKGPFDPTGPGETPSRRRVFLCNPAIAAEESRCARSILSTLARRAYRRPVSEADLTPLLQFYDEGRRAGGFEKGIEVALRRVLVSHEFLFRVEADPARIAPSTNYRISDVALASRLSFFLWSSIPDDSLLDAAVRGELKNPATLRQQVRRMLADDRSQALVKNFAGQWLQLRNLDAANPSLPIYPEFDEGLRKGFRRETELFFDSIVRENRSALDLLTADYTFVDERLARHYGIPNVYGPEFRRVAIQNQHRRGILGQGSILVVTSRPNRTAPVLRGKWILENLLGTPPPPPPANVPPLPERKPGSQAKVLSMRERMAQHRSNPACASCHSMIDPLGFSLENFDGEGKWRDLDEAFQRIDASGSLPDGTTFQNLDEFRRALLSHPERFITTLTEKLLTYALGRGLEPFDMPTVRHIVREAAPGGYRLPDLIVGIINSTPFQMRKSAGHDERVADGGAGSASVHRSPGHQ